MAIGSEGLQALSMIMQNQQRQQDLDYQAGARKDDADFRIARESAVMKSQSAREDRIMAQQRLEAMSNFLREAGLAPVEFGNESEYQDLISTTADSLGSRIENDLQREQIYNARIIEQEKLISAMQAGDASAGGLNFFDDALGTKISQAVRSQDFSAISEDISRMAADAIGESELSSSQINAFERGLRNRISNTNAIVEQDERRFQRSLQELQMNQSRVETGLAQQQSAGISRENTANHLDRMRDSLLIQSQNPAVVSFVNAANAASSEGATRSDRENFESLQQGIIDQGVGLAQNWEPLLREAGFSNEEMQKLYSQFGHSFMQTMAGMSSNPQAVANDWANVSKGVDDKMKELSLDSRYEGLNHGEMMLEAVKNGDMEVDQFSHYMAFVMNPAFGDSWDAAFGRLDILGKYARGNNTFLESSFTDNATRDAERVMEEINGFKTELSTYGDSFRQMFNRPVGEINGIPGGDPDEIETFSESNFRRPTAYTGYDSESTPLQNFLRFMATGASNTISVPFRFGQSNTPGEVLARKTEFLKTLSPEEREQFNREWRENISRGFSIRGVNN